jgi:hypothetical protein
MKYIKKYNNYHHERILERNLILLNDIKINDDISTDIFNKILNNSRIEDSIKIEINNYINNFNLNESFFDKLKDRFPKASTVSNLLSDKAESILNSILQKTKDILSFVKKVSEGIRELFTNVIKHSKSYFEDQIKRGKLKQKIEELTKTKKEGLKRDIVEIKKVLDFYRRDFMSKLISYSENNMSNFLSKEQIIESIILEKGNVIATLVHGVEKIPPFSWLHKLAKAGEAGASQFIKILSDITVKMGGPTFILPVIALILGELMEYLIKSQVGGWLITLTGTTPLGMAILGMKMVATFISLITVIDALFGEKILGHVEHS